MTARDRTASLLFSVPFYVDGSDKAALDLKPENEIEPPAHADPELQRLAPVVGLVNLSMIRILFA